MSLPTPTRVRPKRLLVSCLAVLSAVIVAGVWVGSASAEVRSGSVTDPADATMHQNVDGTSYRDQDIQRITASYDTAGSITMTFYFFDPVPASTRETLNASFNDCNYTNEATAEVTVLPLSSTGYNSASVSIRGYEGSIQATRTLSADHRAITVQASAPVLANRAYSCVNLISQRHYDEYFHCNRYGCFNLWPVTTDAITWGFFIDAATPAFPIPVSDRCVAARNALPKKQKQLKKLKAQLRSTHKRKRMTALAKQIKTTKRAIAQTRAAIEQHC
jgi:hypothetical protein